MGYKTSHVMSAYDIEKSILQWKKQLFKYEAYEPEYIDELEDHLRSSIDELMKQGYDKQEAFNQASSNLQKQHQALNEAFDTNKRRWVANGLVYSFIKVAIRNLHKKWSYSLINLLGLAAGIASILCICGYVYFEYQFDSFHRDKDTIFRVINEYERESGTLRYPMAPPALAPTIEGNISNIKRVTRLRTIDQITLSNGKTEFLESKGFYADSTFLKIFDFELNEGHKEAALTRPNTIILTESMAKKLFPNEDALGQTIQMDGNEYLQVIGILANVPTNSHLHFDFLISFQTYKVPDGYLADLSSWSWMGFLTFVQTESINPVTAIETQLTELYLSRNTSKVNKDIKVTLQPLTDIYLGSNNIVNPYGGLFASNSKSNLMSLIGIAAFIVLIACFNYVNITVATIRSRLRELGMRKVLGSSKSKVFIQIFLESTVAVLISSVLAIFITIVVFNSGVMPIDLLTVFSIELVLLFGFIIVFIILMLGTIIMVAINPIISGSSALPLINNILPATGFHGQFKNTILFTQYLIATCLIIISLIVMRQIDFMNKKELGYDHSKIITISGIPEAIANSFSLFKDLTGDESSIDHVTLASHAFDGGTSSGPMRRSSWSEEQSIQTAYYQVDPDFLRVTGVRLVEGRFYKHDIASDSTESIVLNQQAAMAMKIETLTNQKVTFNNGREFRVIGIVADFHYQSLHHKIGPMALVIPFAALDHILVRFNGDQLSDIYRTIEDNWQITNAGISSPADIAFLDHTLSLQYSNETQLSQVIRLFSGLAILLSCIGLLGLTSVSINSRIKQICIRKVLGASIFNIITIISRHSLISALLATLVAWPISLSVADIWLEEYAYRYEPSGTIWLISFLIILIITLSTLSFQFSKINQTNPAKILKND